jgi:chromate transport protein ChrA
MPMQRRMRLRLLLVLAPALLLAGVDLVVKALVATQAWDFHERSHLWVGFSVALAIAAVALAFVPSRFAAVAAGVVAGGVLGNLVSAWQHGGRVPNPLVAGTVAFNLADVFVLAGAVLQTVALARAAIRHRDRIDRLIPPRRWELALRRRLGL